MVAANVKGCAFKGRQCPGPNGILLTPTRGTPFFLVAYTAAMRRACDIGNGAAGTIECGAALLSLSTSLCF